MEFLAENPNKKRSDVTWDDVSANFDHFELEFEDDFGDDFGDEFGDEFTEDEVEIISDDSDEFGNDVEPLTLEDFEVDGMVPVFENGMLILTSKL